MDLDHLNRLNLSRMDRGVEPRAGWQEWNMIHQSIRGCLFDMALYVVR